LNKVLAADERPELMDVGTATQKPSYKATFRKHRVLLSLPMVLAALAAGYLGFASSKTFMSSASLWVDTAPPAPSSIGSNSQAMSQTPSSAEQGLLNELLSTRTFTMGVLDNSLLGKYLSSTGPVTATRAAAAVSTTQVTTTTAGPQVLQISFTGPSAEVATSALKALVKELEEQSSALSAEHNAAALAYAKAQLAAASRSLQSARQQVSAYLAANPHANIQTDPNLTALVASENAANTQYSTANTTLSESSGTRDAGGWLVQVVDPASVGMSQAPGKKKLIELIFGGLLGGGLISYLATMALTPGRKETWEDEGPPSVLTVPADFTSGSRGGVDSTVGGQTEVRALASERQFIFRGPDDEFGES
jgi:uncharacterized protein involved in exopolysaccharide biosynthesis